ncbi:MAG: tRNA (adenosine(37)-N6)-threonylcarbamoyltransferase complex ATPase subunit type 1 TsaE [Nannocystaceae bacterium]
MIDVAEDLDQDGLVACARALGTLLQGGEVLLLDGAMGAGKTTFTRALAAGLGVDRPDRVTSPTFALCMIHPGPIRLLHLDLYRLPEADADDGEGAALGVQAAAEALGLDSDELAGEDRAVVVEWPDRWISPPEDHLRIAILRPRGTLTQRHIRALAGGPKSSELLSRWRQRVSSEIRNSL